MRWKPSYWFILLGMGGANLIVFAILIQLVSEAYAPVDAPARAALPASTVLPTPTLLSPPSGALPTQLVLPTLPPATIAPLPTYTPWPTLPPLLAPTSFALPEAALITNIIGHKQTLSLSCEARSAADWAGYFGVAIDEQTFLAELPTADDPDVGFVGDPRGAWGQTPPYDYGVHATPIANLLKRYGLPAYPRRAMTLEDLRAEIAAGRPVMVWVVGHVEDLGGRMEYTAGSGHTTLVAPYEHTVLVIGYTADTITVLDGPRQYPRALDTFLASWETLGRLAVMYADF